MIALDDNAWQFHHGAMANSNGNFVKFQLVCFTTAALLAGIVDVAQTNEQLGKLSVSVMMSQSLLSSFILWEVSFCSFCSPIIKDSSFLYFSQM